MGELKTFFFLAFQWWGRLKPASCKLPDGREGVLNKPAFDTTDALKFATEVGKFLTASKFLTIPGRIGAAAATATGFEAAGVPLGGEFEPGHVVVSI